jgi:putative ABC transport system ATP-binding protein
MTELLRLERVGLRYPGPPAIHALRCIDLTIDRHEFIAVTGVSGSGKSTLLNVLGLLDRPTEGRYRIADREVGSLRARETDQLRRSTFGFVFQSSHLLGDRTVAANVALPLQIGRVRVADRAARVADALVRVGLRHRAQARARDLSGGERQRAAIARALVGRPQIILADEPTGNLDEKNTDRVMTLLDDLHRKGLTIVMITHDPVIAGKAPRRIRLADGYLRA